MSWLAAAGVLDRATFTGLLLRADQFAALAAPNLFVLPSYPENFGVAVVEAMACGLPVVISDRVNIWREVKEARAGIVTQPDAGELAQALATVLDDPEVRRRMGAAGRILVRERLTWCTVADQMNQRIWARRRGEAAAVTPTGRGNPGALNRPPVRSRRQ